MEEGKIDFAQKFHRTDRDRQENDSPERAAKSLACPDGRIITMSPFLAEERSDDDDTILCRLPRRDGQFGHKIGDKIECRRKNLFTQPKTNKIWTL